MKVLYDYQILLAQKYGGISRYHYELATRINKMNLAKIDVKCIGSINFYFEKFFNNKSNDRVFKGLSRFNKEITKLICNNYDVVHPTFHDPYLNDKYRGKFVITIHDMIHEIFPEYFKNDPTAINKALQARRADHIITISENTKRDILRFYPDISEDKITVIYHGFSSLSQNYSKDNLPEKYILFVGSRSIYKNFKIFWDVVKILLEEDKDLYLLCIGGGAFSEKELSEFGVLSSRVVQMNASDNLLASAYHYAKCFVFPTLYEGFGIPTLEAFSCDCPAAISNTSSMPEVGGDAVLYFDPTNDKEIYNQIKKLIYNEDLRQELIEKGHKQLEKFNWDETAKRTYAVYTKIMSSN